MQRRPAARWLAGLLMLLLAAAIAYGLWPAPQLVEVARAERGVLQVTINEDGKTRVRDRYTISAPVAGQLARLELREGDEVRRGSTVLAMIQPSTPPLLDVRATAEAEAKLHATAAAEERAGANLVEVKEELELAQHDLQRAQKLFQTGAITREEFDRAEHRAGRADAAVRAVEFSLQVARFEREQAAAALLRTQDAGEAGGVLPTWTITSPIDGRVLRLFHQSAGPVEPGTPLLEIGDSTDLEMEIDVLSSDGVRISPDDPVIVDQWGGAYPLHGRVRRVEPSAFLKISALGVEEQRVNVIADFDEPLARRPTLGDAFRIEAQIVVWSADKVLKIPVAALFREQERWHVFQVLDGRAVRRSVEIGENNGLEAQVLKGLAEGDVVIVYPTDQIRTGVAVRTK